MDAHRIEEDLARLERLEQERLLLDADFEAWGVRQRVLGDTAARLEDERAETELLRRELEEQLQQVQRQHAALQERGDILQVRLEEAEREREEAEATLHLLIGQRDRVNAEFTALYARLERVARGEADDADDRGGAVSARRVHGEGLTAVIVAPPPKVGRPAAKDEAERESASREAEAEAAATVERLALLPREAAGEGVAKVERLAVLPRETASDEAAKVERLALLPREAASEPAVEVTNASVAANDAPSEAADADPSASSSSRWTAPVVRGEAEASSSQRNAVAQAPLADGWFDEATGDLDPTPSFAWSVSPSRTTADSPRSITGSGDDRRVPKPRSTAASGSIYIREAEPPVPGERDDPPPRHSTGRTLAWVALAACIPAALWLGSALTRARQSETEREPTASASVTDRTEAPVVIVMPVLGPPITAAPHEDGAAAKASTAPGARRKAPNVKARRPRRPGPPNAPSPATAKTPLNAPSPTTARTPATKRIDAPNGTRSSR